MHHHKRDRSHRDWSHYNQHLINRGKIHFWVNPDSVWQAPLRHKNGHPFVYADEAIEAMLYIRFKFHRSLRECEGFFISLMEICKKMEKVPYSTHICQRIKRLSLPKKLLEKRLILS